MKAHPLHLAPACLLLLSAASLSALSTHTWVAANGNDANSGTATSPYADFATAVANTAAGGTISVVGPGDYGQVNITNRSRSMEPEAAALTSPATARASIFPPARLRIL